MDVVKIPREDKLQIVEQIQSYLENELSENIGNLVAEGLLDMIASHIAPYVYNEAIRDARTIALQQMERVEDELNLLEKPLRKTR